MPLTLGYKASAEQFGPRELVDLAVEAEAHGFASLVVSDHFQPWRHEGGHAPFALACLAAMGERTSSIRLGTSVLTPTFRYNPAVVAQAVATLACLSPGRVMLGVGTGEALNEIAAGLRSDDGEPWPPFKERLGRLDEALGLMRELWSGERVNASGDYFAVQDAAIYDLPDAPPPVYVAAGGPRVARFAGGTGDGVICTSGKDRELYTDELLPAVREGAESGGRDIDALDLMIEIKLSYEEDEATALENTRFWSPLSLTPEQKHSMSDPAEVERAADALPIEQVARRWIVGTDPDETVERIADYVRMGFGHLVFHAPGADQRRFMDLFERDLAPRLRELG